MCPSKFQGFFSILVFCNYHDKVFRIFIDFFCLCLADGYLLLNCAQSEQLSMASSQNPWCASFGEFCNFRNNLRFDTK